MKRTNARLKEWREGKMTANVIRLENHIMSNNSVTNSILSLVNEFADEAGANSQSTKSAYLNDLKQFLSKTYGTENVKVDLVVHTMNRKQLIQYRSVLIKSELKPSTINRKMSAIIEFAKFLYNSGYEIDLVGINNIAKLKTSKNSYEVLSYDEAFEFINWFKENEKEKAIDKYYYTALAFDTGIRAEALNNITPQSFIWKKGEVILKGIDKGKKQFIKSLSLEFASAMFDELQLDKNSNEPIFNFSSELRYKMMKRAKKALGYENRNITFHSFKKGAVNYAYEATKDIQIAKQVGNHANINTTQIYLEDNKQAFQGAISNKQKIDTADIRFSEYSKTELIEVLSNLPEAMQFMLKKELALLTKIK
ncbi:site-specific integrase [Staphylococcus pseudintermedius]|nr:site-specific integrase [Staphylococcus pseudintermedius]EIT1274130.1 site-specific integrase [Staphylococcus pseudintermedius]EJH4520016.1 site-specific integrase [Staphylococcus pseudintermedius]EJL1300394.1 site-specific integrase [Staphylococcus pseudintermedius]